MYSMRKTLKHLSLRLMLLLFMMGYVLLPHEGNYFDAVVLVRQATPSVGVAVGPLDLTFSQNTPDSAQRNSLVHPDIFAVSEYQHFLPVVPVRYLPVPLVTLADLTHPNRVALLREQSVVDLSPPQALVVLNHTVLLI